jgi:hypothetical protein
MASSGESIYKWIAPVPVVPEKPPMYKSSAAVVAHSKELVASTIRVKHAKHVMGSISTREEPLIAHSKDKTLNPHVLPGPFKYPASNVPPVPRRDERPLSLPASGKSFVQQNAVDAIMAPRRAREKAAPVDWLKVPSFGKVPAYLDSVKQELEQERDLMVQMLDAQQMESEASSGAHTREMADDERHELIEALKRKWDTVNVRASAQGTVGGCAPRASTRAAFACLGEALTPSRLLSPHALRRREPAQRALLTTPLLPPPSHPPPPQDKYQVISHRNISTSNSTKGEIRWKETCEQQMAQLEKDILKLSSNGPIYIVE